MFIIEDEIHCESIGRYVSVKEAYSELEKFEKIPWNEKPNCAPCMSWETCGREYVIIEYDDSTMPWNEIRRIPALSIRKKGIYWKTHLPD